MTTRSSVLIAVLSFVLLLGWALPSWAGDPPTATGADDPAAEVDGEEPPIVLYMTSWCPYCRKAQDLLDEIDADYVAKDIEKDPQAHREFQRLGKGSSGIPLIDFGGKTLRGFNPEKIRKLADEVARRN